MQKYTEHCINKDVFCDSRDITFIFHLVYQVSAKKKAASR